MLGALTEWWERRKTLRELKAIDRRGNEDFAGFFKDQIDIATETSRKGDRQKPLEIWRKMHALYPDLALKSEAALSLLIDLNQHDEAEAMIQEGRGRQPRLEPMYAALAARNALARGDVQLALTRAEDLRRKHPDRAEGYTVAGEAMNRLAKPDEAENFIGQGVKRIAADGGLAERYARLAMDRHDWAEGRTRWKLVWDRFETTQGLLGQAECLMHLGQFDEAAGIIDQACDRFSMNPWCFATRAELATFRGAAEDAVTAWRAVLNQFPWFDRAYWKMAEALQRNGRDADADEILRVGAGRSPEDQMIAQAWARSGERLVDREQARTRWAEVARRFPNLTEARERLEALDLR